MFSYKTKGIVLKRRDVGEADKIITVFGEKEGKIIARAKGVRKILAKNGGSVELFTLADFIFISGKKMDILTSATIINSFSNLKKNLKKTGLAYYFAELVDKLTLEKERNEEVFDLLCQTFSVLNNNKFSIAQHSSHLIIQYCELNLLSFLGFRPQLEFCLKCGEKISPVKNYFSFQSGGIYCSKCSQNGRQVRSISPDALKILKIILRVSLEKFLKIKIHQNIQKEAREIINKFLIHIAEREFKSVKFLKQIDETEKVI